MSFPRGLGGRGTLRTSTLRPSVITILILRRVAIVAHAERRTVMQGSELRSQLREIRYLWWDIRWAVRAAIEVHRDIVRDLLRGIWP